jgi:hypothetical protein
MDGSQIRINAVLSASTTEEFHVLAKSFGADVELYLAPDEPASPPPSGGYATLGQFAPIAWPSGATKVPVTGQLSPHAAAALERMGITKTSK